VSQLPHNKTIKLLNGIPVGELMDPRQSDKVRASYSSVPTKKKGSRGRLLTETAAALSQK
jgi:hypothetical protein